jgi:hypothetical protein
MCTVPGYITVSAQIEPPWFHAAPLSRLSSDSAVVLPLRQLNINNIRIVSTVLAQSVALENYETQANSMMQVRACGHSYARVPGFGEPTSHDRSLEALPRRPHTRHCSTLSVGLLACACNCNFPGVSADQ